MFLDLRLIHVKRAIDLDLQGMHIARRLAVVLGNETTGKWGIAGDG